ncbi:MAG: PKD domain-containing protein [Bacteroidota bacterium]|nr:PKD domain-containing protein [Bacteroidota bacterium]
MKKVIASLVIVLFVSFGLFSQTKVSKKSGGWSKAATWIPSGVPTATDNVLISSGHKVSIDGNFACNSLTVGTTALTMSTLEFKGNTARSFTVFADIMINNADTFDIKNNSNTTHTVTFFGNIVNNGGMQFFPDANSKCIALFKKNGNQTITGTGSFSKFSDIVVDMGTSAANILDVSVSNFTVPIDFLKLNNGTFKISTTNLQNITTFTAPTIIPSSAGLWLNSSNVTVNTQNSIINSGLVSITNGTLNIGDAINEDFLYASGSFSMANGELNVAGKYSGIGNTNFTLNNGNVKVATIGSSDLINAPFQITTTGSNFNMTGGSLIILREGGLGPQDLGYINLAGSGSVTGGTLQIGNLTSPTNQNFNINTTLPIGNLLINNSTATAILNTNSITVLNNITLNSGALNSNNLSITLGGSWQNNSGLFTPGNNTVNFNSSSAQSIFKPGGETFNQITFSGTGVKSLLSPITANSNLIINTGSNLDISASNFSITSKGNFVNNGSFNCRSGLVFFNGSGSQNISGTSTTDFFDITLTNPTGASLANPMKLYGTMKLTSGVFNTNFNSFTMVSTATATARIDQITGTGDINGFVTIQRFAPGGTTGWALIGAPVTTGLSYSDWDDNIAISCPTCPDGYVANFPSIYTYDETAVGSYSNPISYIPINTINDPITPTKGYWVYLGDGQYTTNDIMIDVIGQVGKFNITIPLNYSNYGSPIDDGWNLISNPYPSPISWTALKGATPNIDNAIYAYNADLNGGAGANATFINGISSPAIGSGGIGDVIPMCQGFYVHSTGATVLNGTEAVKVAGNPTFLKSSSTPNTSGIVRLNMNGPYGFNDESVLYIQSGATNNFDGSYDAVKLAGQNPYAPTIAIQESTIDFQVNGIPPISGNYTTSLKTLTGYTGSYTISASDINSFPVGTCFNLYDKYTSVSTNLINSDYVFNLEDTTTAARFILSITLNPLQITSNVSQPTCQNINGGEIIAKGLSAGPWNYYWKDANNTTIQTSLNKSTADTLSSLWTGNYTLDITTVGMCDNNQSTYSIIQKNPAYASFSCVDTCYLNQNPIVQFNNTSSNAASQSWNFGDNFGTSFVVSPSYQYAVPGLYSVSLIANSSNGCIDTVVKNIFVLDNPVGIKSNSLADFGLIVKTLTDNKFIIEKELKETSVLNYYLYDALGKEIIRENGIRTTKLNIALNLNSYKAGIYFLNINLNGENITVKLPVKN